MSKKTSSKLTLELETAINYYRDTKRLDVVKPFASLFDPFAPRDRETFQSPSHRGLFWAFSLQFSLLAWSDSLLELCQGVTALEKKRRRMRCVLVPFVQLFVKPCLSFSGPTLQGVDSRVGEVEMEQRRRRVR